MGWTPERRARHRATKRRKALGNRRLQNGYWQVMTLDGYRYEHRVVMEDWLGIKLTTSQHVHHLNGDKLDNRLRNLMVIEHSAHSRITHTGRPCSLRGKHMFLGWARHFDKCIECGDTKSPHAAKGVCRACYAKRYR